MRVHYTGRTARFSAAQERKLDAKFQKCHKILGRKRDLEAHVKMSRQRHLFDAEITLRALSHTLVVSGSSMDAFLAVQSAVEKLERQVIRNKHKLIDVRRHQSQRAAQAEAPVPRDVVTASEAPFRGQLVRSNSVAPKPLTVEEAMMQIDELGKDHLTYRDMESGELRVLVRRRDGKLELIEAS